MNHKQIVYLFGLVIGPTTVSAFHPLRIVLLPHRHSCPTSFFYRISSDSKDLFTTHDEDICEREECAILEGTSPKVVKLRKQLQAAWKDPLTTAPIILYGPRGSGKGELADEIVYHLPSWQTQNVHWLSLDDGLHFIDTILGTAAHPGLLDDLAGQTNTTLVLKGFQSLHVDSKDEFDRRKELLGALNSLVVRREFFSTFENKTKPFFPRVVRCTQ